ncbi:uncharacterized protein LOC116106165 [Pistacia vera]|uniref:uncharacterized protein LOC116106165 n=1 Tax=Pistacia vera TaxID=55513 RepID=UPI0012638511|nr:uncharacterized protein LOC116106165 [Pistacia vera]
MIFDFSAELVFSAQFINYIPDFANATQSQSASSSVPYLGSRDLICAPLKGLHSTGYACFQKQLYARRHFLFPPMSIEEYNDRVMAVGCCEAQDALLQELLEQKDLMLFIGIFSPNFLMVVDIIYHRDVLRWGKNIISAKTQTRKRAGTAVYNRASSLETLVGYLYLTNANRLEEVIGKLGFSTGSSTQPILEEQVAS